MDKDKKITQLEEQIIKLQNQLNDLSGQFYRNNFTSSQSFNKACVFNDRLRVPVFNSAPTVSEVGDIACIGTTLYICTVANATWTVVGTQS